MKITSISSIVHSKLNSMLTMDPKFNNKLWIHGYGTALSCYKLEEEKYLKFIDDIASGKIRGHQARRIAIQLFYS